MQSGATWKEISSKTDGKGGTWTISGCTPGKPLFIILQAKEFMFSYIRITPISGVVNCDIGWDGKSQLNYMLGGIAENTSTNALVLIPSSTVVAVYTTDVHGNWAAYAYN